MKRKALIVYNPSSGKRKSEGILNNIVSRLNEASIDNDVLQTKLGLPGYIEKAVSERTTDVIAIGGDGTLNHVINGLKNCELTLNIIPAGTGNDFVKNIDIGKTLDEQIHTIFHGKEIEIDVGQCNGQLFLNGVGLGFDGQIVSDMLHKKSWLSGHTKYYFHVLQILATFRPVLLKYSIDSEMVEKEILLLAIANGTTYGGGFRLAPNASISDGLLDICSIGDISPLRRFLNIHKLGNGTHASLEAVRFETVQSVQIESNPLIVGHIDGEFLGNPPFDINVLPKFLKLRVKENFQQ